MRLGHPLRAETITLTAATFSDGSHQYYHELLARSLAQQGHQVTFDAIEDKPQQWITASLRRELLSFHWFLQTEERDTRFVPIPIHLTEGLIGKRVLLIPKGSQSLYDKVATLPHFRDLGLTGALGKDWYDGKVWEKNHLAYQTVPKWRNIFSMVAAKSRGIDYFPRGVNEVLLELKKHQGLEIEARLLFSYDRDFIFYLSQSHQHLAPIITAALRAAKDNGLMNTLIEQHWHTHLTRLNLNQRTLLPLTTPKSL